MIDDPMPPYLYEGDEESSSPVIICSPGGCTLQLTRVVDGKVYEELHIYSTAETRIVDPGHICLGGPCSLGGGYNAYRLQVVPLPEVPVTINRIPEPSGIVMAMVVLLALTWWRRRHA